MSPGDHFNSNDAFIPNAFREVVLAVYGTGTNCNQKVTIPEHIGPNLLDNVSDFAQTLYCNELFFF
jgi:hypothetical protein